MRDALRLMAKVFAVVFGAGAAVVVLGYLVLGGLYIYNRIEAPKQSATPDYDALAKKDGGIVVQPTESFAQLYDVNGFIPDLLPEAQLDCADEDKPWVKARGKGPLCWVEIDKKIAATIAPQEAKANLAGWMTVSPDAKDRFANFGPPEKLRSSHALSPCPENDPLGLNQKSKCAPLPGQKTNQ
jgi:hypothetical protein